MKSILKSFDELSAKELYDILYLRQNVFIIEQDCIYSDIDGNDHKALHLLIHNAKSLIAYLRIFPPGVKTSESSIGRIVVAPGHRGTGLGKELINSGIRICQERYPESSIKIEAQAALKEYYSNYGFVPEGDVYVWDGIDHIKMVLTKD
jgi:ElaA protein